MAERQGNPAGAKGTAGSAAPGRGGRMALALVLGVVKGGALGAGAAWLATQNALPAWLLCGLLGTAVGLVAGRPFWREGAWVATILKAAVGFPVGLGARWLAFRVGLAAQPWLWLPLFAAVWALLLEIDDAVGESPGNARKPSG